MQSKILIADDGPDELGQLCASFAESAEMLCREVCI